MEEREKWEKEKSSIQTQRNEEEYRRAMSAVDNAILDLLPKTKEAKAAGMMASSIQCPPCLFGFCVPFFSGFIEPSDYDIRCRVGKRFRSYSAC
jgi:hypothetical protein